MQKNYLITIFSRDKGKTRTFSLDRRLIYIPLVALLLLVVSCILFGRAYFQERGERQRLESRVALLEKPTNKLEDNLERQGGRASEKVEAKPPKEVKTNVQKEVKAKAQKEVRAKAKEEVKAKATVQQPMVNVALKREEKKAANDSRELGLRSSGETENKYQSVEPPAQMDEAKVSSEPAAKIDDAKVSSLEGNMEGFRLDFKLVNLFGEPISGNVAIIASLKPPHQPRFVSFPSMQLSDGMPVRLRKSVGFNIRYFKYVTGRFFFPFSYSESFRILVYNRDEELILDSTLPAEEVAVYGLLSDEQPSSAESSYITSNIN